MVAKPNPNCYFSCAFLLKAGATEVLPNAKNNGSLQMTKAPKYDMGHEVSARTPSFRDYWQVFLIEGIVLIILGSAAIVVPPIASVAIAIFLGWLFLVGGLIGFVASLAGRQAPGFPWSLISAIVTIVAGSILIFRPFGGTISLTFVLTAFLIADGVLTILFSLEHLRHRSQRWAWLLTNGILDLLLAGFIVWTLPGSAIWVLGLIVGIDLVFGGYSLVMMALAVHASKSR